MPDISTFKLFVKPCFNSKCHDIIKYNYWMKEYTAAKLSDMGIMSKF